MKLGNKNKNKKQEKKEPSDTQNDIEIVYGDNSNLAISDVGSCVNDLRPKNQEKKKKEIVIPKNKNK